MVQHATADHSTTSRLLRQTLTLATVTTLVVGTGTAFVFWKSQSSDPSNTTVAEASVPQLMTVTALGRLEPQGEVIKLSVPGSTEGNRIEELLVKEGDRVKANQVIAILDSRDRLQAALDQAKEQVQLAQANLEKVKAGAKTGEIDAQRATIARLETERQTEIAAQEAVLARLETERQTEIAAQEATIARIQAQQQGELEAQKATLARLEAELRNAQNEEQRRQKLYEDGAISQESWDSKRLNRETTEQQLQEAKANLNRIQATYNEQYQEGVARLTQIRNARQQQIEEAKAKLTQAEQAGQEKIKEAKATLNRIAEVRPVDVAAAEVEVRSAQASVKQAEANLKLAYIYAPRDGQVLKIHTYPGEQVGSDGILELGETQQMIAVAEVYESDVQKVRVGQKATVTSDSFGGELAGTVEQVGLQVLRQNVINTDPSANTDARIVEVKVRLDETSSRKVSGLTNLQVKVVIQQE